MIDHIARRCPFDLFFLSTISYTRASTFYYRYSIEQQVLSSLWCPQRRTFFLRFFLFEPSYIYTYIYIDKALFLGQLHSLCLSVSLVLYTLGSMSVSHCRFMLACIANTSVRCIFGNEHVIKEKNFFLFFLLKS
jgi:arginine exporter protein ArgO